MVAAKEKRRVEMAALELKWRVEMAAVEGVAERSVRMAAGKGTEESEWQPWREDWVKRKCWNGRGKGNANVKTVEVERVYLETDYRHFSPYVSSYVTAVCAFFFFFFFPLYSKNTCNPRRCSAASLQSRRGRKRTLQRDELGSELGVLFHHINILITAAG